MKRLPLDTFCTARDTLLPAGDIDRDGTETGTIAHLRNHRRSMRKQDAFSGKIAQEGVRFSHTSPKNGVRDVPRRTTATFALTPP